MYVEEAQGFVTICLLLSGVEEPTEAEIWADVTSQDGTAMGQRGETVLRK